MSPNQPRDDNRPHPIRFEDELWADVQAVAAEDGVSASEVVREGTRRYMKARASVAFEPAER